MWQTIRCEGDMVRIHFFSASFFPSYHDSATLMAGMEGAATFVRRSILDISVHMWYLNSMGSSFVKKRKLCRDNDWNKLVCWDITDCCLHARPMVS